MNSKLRITASLFTNIHPLAYLFLYWILIAIFGLLYSCFTPTGFYAPYTRYEEYSYNDNEELRKTLEESIKNKINKTDISNLTIDEWVINKDSLRVINLKATPEDQLTFTVTVSAIGIGKNSGIERYGESTHIVVDNHPYTRSLSQKEVITHRTPRIDTTNKSNTQADEFEKNLFNLIFNKTHRISGTSSSLISFTVREEKKFTSYIKGVNGNPSSTSGNTMRMLYLSIVVATTLGLGDIIPITPTARFLVASEAILGITIAGLFINSLSSRRTTCQTTGPSESNTPPNA